MYVVLLTLKCAISFGPFGALVSNWHVAWKWLVTEQIEIEISESIVLVLYRVSMLSGAMHLKMACNWKTAGCRMNETD